MNELSQMYNGLNMIRRISSWLVLLMLVSTGAWAQVGLPEGATQGAPVLKTTHIYKDTLALDYYTIKTRKSVETVETVRNPLVVLVHGGGFYGGRRDGAGEEKFSREMAQKGFDVASISYRLTRKASGFGCDCPARDKITTFLNATEDLMAAIDFLEGNPGFEFDREHIFILGSSAGAETVLTAAYMTGHYEFKSIEPRKFAGVIALSGAVIDSDYITKENAIPALLVHGEKDDLVPFGTAPHHYCETSDPGYLMLDGSNTIAARLEALGTSYILAEDPEGNHDWADEGYELIELIGQFIENVKGGTPFGGNRIRIQSN
jgi:acetyl esterase/lipase